MNILFICTDNFTRSVIAELCMKDYLKRTKNNSVHVASSGIRAHSNISQYSNAHFKIMEDLGIDTSDFERTPLDHTSFATFDVLIGMSPFHKEYMKQQYNRDIYLFNELVIGQQTPVTIGAPDSVDFLKQMNQLVMYIHHSIPSLLKNLEEVK